MKDFWNQRYAEEGYAYGQAPNEFFASELAKREPGRVLLLAEGEGRNAVHAASKGWQVSAMDFSEQARKKALAWAEAEGLELNYQLGDLAQLDFADESFDAIGLIYVHMPPALRQKVHQQVCQWLKPGGVVILEAFHPAQLGRSSGGPQAIEMLYAPEMMEQDFNWGQCHYLMHQEVELKEGPYHHGSAMVTRLVVEKI